MRNGQEIQTISKTEKHIHLTEIVKVHLTPKIFVVLTKFSYYLDYVFEKKI